MTLRQAAAKTGHTVSYISQLCRAGRIEGAVRDPMSRWWTLPDNFKVTPAKRGRPRIIATFNQENKGE